MAGGGDIAIMYWQNHSASDTVCDTIANLSTAQSYTTLGFSEPEGMVFSEWNTERDGSGISYAIGDPVTLNAENTATIYAIWVPRATSYIVTREELTDVADAIREKGGTSALLSWPTEYVEAVGDIQTGGGTILDGYTSSNVNLSGTDRVTLDISSSITDVFLLERVEIDTFGVYTFLNSPMSNSYGGIAMDLEQANGFLISESILDTFDGVWRYSPATTVQIVAFDGTDQGIYPAATNSATVFYKEATS